MSAANEPPVRPIELRLPADAAYVGVVRTTASAVAARTEFTMEDIEELRIAVGESAALAVQLAAPGVDLEARFRLRRDEVAVELSVPTDSQAMVDKASFSWRVLSDVAPDVSADIVSGCLVLRLSVQSNVSVA